MARSWPGLCRLSAGGISFTPLGTGAFAWTHPPILSEDAEDITPQAFQKAFVHLRQFQGEFFSFTWLTRIAMNEALMWLRRKRGFADVPLEKQDVASETPLALDPPDSDLNPEETC